MTWPEEKLFRFTRHHRFENLTAEDQAAIWQKLEMKVAQPAPPPSPLPSAVPPLAPKLLRIPTELGVATEMATSPHRPLIGGELRAAMASAAIHWLSIIVGGIVLLKLFSGG